MIVNGINLDELLPDVSELHIPPPVAGRTVHIDADFLAYQTTASGAGKEVSFDDMKHNASVAIQTLKDMAGAEHVHLHTTPSGSTKGGRYDIAILKEYQSSRKDKEKPQFLNLMRKHLTEHYPGTAHQFAEADDGMASAQYASLAQGTGHLSIIASKDKDLRMVPGLHLDWDTGEIINVIDPYGYTEIVQRVSAGGTKTSKLVGYGWAYFWAQMLTGDQADTISGLPCVHRDVMLKLKPTAAQTKALKLLEGDAASPEKVRIARDYLASCPHKPCGPVLANELLGRVSSNKAAFGLVKGLFKLLDGEFRHWQTGVNVPWQDAMLSEMKLLWMRRDPLDHNDVVKWLRKHAV